MVNAAQAIVISSYSKRDIRNPAFIALKQRYKSTAFAILWLLSLIITSSPTSTRAAAIPDARPTSLANLQIKLSTQSLQYGRPLRIAIDYFGRTDLQTLDLSEWRKLAAIELVDYLSETNNGLARGPHNQQLLLKLYPRQIGPLQLPVLRLGRAKAEAPIVTIKSVSVDNHAVQLDFKSDRQPVWQRQAVLLTYTLHTTDETAHLRLSDESPLPPDWRLEPLPAQRSPTDKGYQIRIGWRLYPAKGGDYSLELPALEYRLSGSPVRRFHVPLLQLKVDPLPAYLSPVTPIGQLEIESRVVADQWQINVNTDATLNGGLPGLDAQLAEFNGQAIDAIQISQLAQDWQHSRLRHIQYRVPLPEFSIPGIHSHVLSVELFDAKTGKLRRLEHSLPAVWRIPSEIQKGGLGLVGIVLFTLLLRRRRQLSHVYRKLLRQIRSRIARSKTSDADAIRRSHLASGDYRCLQDWVDAGRTAKVRAGREVEARRLNRACFGFGDDSCSEVH